MVSKASEDFPDPDTPVTTVKLLLPIVKSIFLRVWTRAPQTTMLSVDICNWNPPQGRLVVVLHQLLKARSSEEASESTESLYYTARGSGNLARAFYPAT